MKKEKKSRWPWWCSAQIIFVVVLICVVIYLIRQDKRESFPVDERQYVSTKKKKLCDKKNEKRCRAIVQRIFGVPFPTVRPDWLRNPKTKKRLELDLFNKTIKTPLGRGLAFEYDGIQHEQYTPFYHRKGPQQFVEQHERDVSKDKQCLARGILLIRIPSMIVYEKLEEYIVEKLKEKGVRSTQR